MYASHQTLSLSNDGDDTKAGVLDAPQHLRTADLVSVDFTMSNVPANVGQKDSDGVAQHIAYCSSYPGSGPIKPPPCPAARVYEATLLSGLRLGGRLGLRDVWY